MIIDMNLAVKKNVGTCTSTHEMCVPGTPSFNFNFVLHSVALSSQIRTYHMYIAVIVPGRCLDGALALPLTH